MKKQIPLFFFFFLPLILKTQRDSTILQAIRMNDLPGVKEAIRQGTDVNARDENGASVLMWATYFGDLEMISYLIERGADYKQKGLLKFSEDDYYGSLPAIAVAKGKRELLKYFIEVCRIDVDDQEWNPETGAEDGWTPLKLALALHQTSCVEYLLGKGAVEDPALEELSIYYKEKGQYPEALRIARKALEVTASTKGKEVPEYGTRLNNLGLIYQRIRDYEPARMAMMGALRNYENNLGIDHPWYRVVLDNLATLLQDMKNYSEAMPLRREILKHTEQTLGKDHPAYFTHLSRLVDLYQAMGEKEEALRTLHALIEESSRALGETHPDLCLYLNLAGKLYAENGDFEKARSYFISSLDIAEEKLGKQSEMYFVALNNLAEQYRKLGDYQTPLPRLLEAENTAENDLGPLHRETIRTLSNLAAIYEGLGQYEKVPSLYLNALDKLEKSLGRQHPEYGKILNDLAFTYQTMGNYEAAQPLYQEALAITEKSLGKDHYWYGSRLLNLADVYRLQGLYEKALPCYLETLGNLEKTLGRDHPSYGICLNNLALLYQQMGEFSEASRYLLQALDNTAGTLGKDHSAYGINQGNLGMVYVLMGRDDEALPLLNAALENAGKTLGKDHYQYGICLNNLAGYYKGKGDFTKAEALFQEALETVEKRLGKGHFEYGTALGNLANTFLESGETDQALSCLLAALRNTEESLGKDHARYGQALSDLAIGYQIAGDPAKALGAFLASDQNRNAQIRRRFAAVSERLQVTLINEMLRDYDRFFSFALDHPEFERAADAVYDDLLLLKGLLQGNTNILLQELRNSPDTALLRRFREWESIHRTLSGQYVKPLDQRLPSLDSLERQADRLENLLASESASFKEAREGVGWETVKTMLGPGEAAVEFSHFNYYRQGIPTDSVMYVAWILRPEWDHPRSVFLFEAQTLEDLLRGSRENKIAYVSALYTFRGVRPRQRQNMAYQDLRKLIWEPLDSLLQGIDRVCFAPSGLLHRINLGAIPVEKDRLAADKYALFCLGSTRSLCFSKGPEEKPIAKTALLLGGIHFDQPEDSLSVFQGTEMPASLNQTVDPSGAIARSSGPDWPFLPGTVREVAGIREVLEKAQYQVDLQQGGDATEARFKQLGKNQASPFILHIATHGFFFPDPKTETERTWHDPGQLPPVQLSEHPMVRSGLILAGGNHSWQGRPLPEGSEDGILTAYEISRLDLRHTELVVLSACETGLGDIQGNEGVFGLQRAFRIAGAKQVIMSLWQVPDEDTRQLMIAFYQGWMEGKSIREAFYQAQQQMRRQKKDPYSWAGFVLVE